MSSSQSFDTASFVRFLLESEVLRFGNFTTKSGRQTPYFFDAGRFGRGSQAERLGEFYAERLLAAVPGGFDVLFGPAYKGIPLAVATATALARRGRDVGFCFNRKEAKDHGEGGVLIGHRLKDGDRVVIIEDVTTAGTSVRETVPLLRATAKVELVGLIVAVDRQERGQGTESAFTELAREFGLRAFSIADIDQIVEALRKPGAPPILTPELEASLHEYRRKYGAV
ncbi:MAG: Orotate phosphoribosyltransferase [Pseudomonadota bacterium]